MMTYIQLLQGRKILAYRATTELQVDDRTTLFGNVPVYNEPRDGVYV